MELCSLLNNDVDDNDDDDDDDSNAMTRKKYYELAELYIISNRNELVYVDFCGYACIRVCRIN